jgi:hypothetical protein
VQSGITNSIIGCFREADDGVFYVFILRHLLTSPVLLDRGPPGACIGYNYVSYERVNSTKGMIKQRR